MKYGRIASSNQINTSIYHCFEYICDEDEQKFMKKFRKQPKDSDQIMHTFRELILGAYLCLMNFKARYEHAVNNDTPDWSILNINLKPIAIIELTNFHIDKATEIDIEKQRRTKYLVGYWRDGNIDNKDRLYHSILHKAQVYKNLVQKLRIPYIVTVFSDNKVALDELEFNICLFSEKYNFFKMYPEVSGVLHFEENNGQYSFKYTQNPNAQSPFDLPNGVFPSDKI